MDVACGSVVALLNASLEFQIMAIFEAGWHLFEVGFLMSFDEPLVLLSYTSKTSCMAPTWVLSMQGTSGTPGYLGYALKYHNFMETFIFNPILQG